MMIIGISGKKGTGKDLLASFLRHKYGFVNTPFAAELKSAVRRDFDLTMQHTDGPLKELPLALYKQPVLEGMPHQGNWTPRAIMIAYGQFFRQFDKDYWVKKTFNKIREIRTFQTYGAEARISISDVRFRNEANFIKEQGGIVVRLERKPELNIYKDVSNDVSETDLDNWNGFDFNITAEQNILPEDLGKFADFIMANQGVVQ